MAKREPMLLVPQKLELTTQEAAAFLHVSRPFVIKEIEANRLVNRHRRIEFEELSMAGSARYTAVLDANALYPALLKDRPDQGDKNSWPTGLLNCCYTVRCPAWLTWRRAVVGRWTRFSSNPQQETP